MAETPAESDRRPPRFPYVAALLCAACVGAAAWTWMRYSHCWDVTVEELSEQHWPLGLGIWNGAYLRTSGARTSPGIATDWCEDVRKYEFHVNWTSIYIQVAPTSDLPPTGVLTTFRGRVVAVRRPSDLPDHIGMQIDTTASRVHGASVAGLVVGAMGVFVFTVALRHWLNQRRAQAQ